MEAQKVCPRSHREGGAEPETPMVPSSMVRAFKRCLKLQDTISTRCSQSGVWSHISSLRQTDGNATYSQDYLVNIKYKQKGISVS